MAEASSFRRHLTELVVVFVGVALAFAVENLREDLNERAVGNEYLHGFRADLQADLEMLDEQLDARRGQLRDSQVALEYFDGRAIDPQRFFEAYYPALMARYTAPNRNTMDEVLSSGNLRLIRDPEVRSALLDLYVTYGRIAKTEEHMSRDFDHYLYDPTFSSVRFRLDGPWEDTPENRSDVESLLKDLRIENGLLLIVANLDFGSTALLRELEMARSQVEGLLRLIPAE